jgi:ACS family tartrate transporter-like MFS transporter
MEERSHITQRRVMRKIVTRLMPALLALYVIAYLDRVNVTFAQDRLEEDLGFSGAVYGFGAGIFFIGYFLLEVPSNLALHRFGARKWMARIMITWGLISACTVFVSSPISFYAVRFLLGIAEAGFFPGMILYLSLWFPARERAKAVGVFMSAIAISYAIGAPISGGIMSVMGGVAGLEDWQWLFVLEAIPAIVAGVLVFLKLPDGPAEAKWLDAGEKEWLQATLDGEDAERETPPIGQAIKDRRVLLFAALYFTMVVNVYGLSFWVGKMVDQIDGIGDVAKGFVTAIPYAVAIVGMIVIPRYSDRTGERKAVVSISLALAATAFVVSTVVGPVAAIPALAVGLFFLLGVHGVFWTMPTAILTGAAAAAGIAAINSIGNIGGFVGPYLVGLIEDATGSTDGGLIVLAALLLIGSLIALKVSHEKDLERPPEETLARTGRFDRTPDRERAGHMAD